MSNNRFFERFSAWQHSAIVLALFSIFGLPFGVLLGSHVAFDFINLGIVLAILTYIGQVYVMPYVFSELRKDRAETARLERQEDSFASQAESLTHDAARLTHYNAGLKQRMRAWITANQLKEASQREEQGAVKTRLEQRSLAQMHNRYDRELSYQALCSALKKAEYEIAQKYTDERCLQEYMRSILVHVQEEA